MSKIRIGKLAIMVLGIIVQFALMPTAEGKRVSQAAAVDPNSDTITGVKLSGYSPNCKADHGDGGHDESAYSNLKPSDFELDGDNPSSFHSDGDDPHAAKKYVMMASSDQSMKGKCFKVKGGNADDDGDNAKYDQAVHAEGTIFAVADYCPTCRDMKDRHFDIPFACKKTVKKGRAVETTGASDFRIRNATLVKVPCPYTIMAQIRRDAPSLAAKANAGGDTAR